MGDHQFELLLLRHAKSSWDVPGLADHDRPLNPRGIQAAARMGRFCVESNLRPDRIVASDSCRTSETIDRLLEATGWSIPVLRTQDLYLATPETIASIIATSPADVRRLLVVAHNPGIEAFSSELAGRPLRCPTATLSSFRIAASSWSCWADGEIEHLGTWRPKELDD
jgi:phosphohistidine phosphatase